MKFFRGRRAAPPLLLLAFVATICTAQVFTPQPELAARLDRRLGEMMAQRRFSGAVLVARAGKVILKKGYGMANHEFDIPNTPRTKFRLGSLTKQFTAAAVMLLEERGRLSVQDSVCKHVENCPAAWQPVTLHHLLTHSSGVPTFTGTPEYRSWKRQPTTVAETLKLFRERPLEFTPGERFNYSNSGYVLLGHVVEKASGKSYEDFLRENIFAPLGMKDTGYDRAEQVLKNRASGYFFDGDRVANAPYIDMSVPHAAGALYSTVEDLYLWDQALHGGKLLSRKSLDAMTTPLHQQYGYGLSVGKQFGLRRVAHGGAIEGFNTFMAHYPEENATVIVLMNLERLSAGAPAVVLARELLADKVVLPATVKVEPSVLRSYAGRYEVDPTVMPNAVVDVTIEGDKIFVKPSNQFRHELAPVSATEFFDFDDPGDQRFVFGKDERGVETLTLKGAGPRPVTARKLTLPAPSLKGNTTFKLKGHETARLVALAGGFNNWNQSHTVCAKEPDGWVCRIDLAPGKHLYKFVVDGVWLNDPDNPNREADGSGNVNSVLSKN
ncbi:MAG TPA: serine hydrolase [Pyrinomonadaceae bacterium]|nr:serine hydrolase [Pyrinomonadaceae bacterium]